MSNTKKRPANPAPTARRAQTFATRRDGVLHGMAWHGMAWYGMVWYGMVWYGMVWYGMVEVCEGAPVAMSGWVLTNRHDLAPCAANSLHRVTSDNRS